MPGARSTNPGSRRREAGPEGAAARRLEVRVGLQAPNKPLPRPRRYRPLPNNKRMPAGVARARSGCGFRVQHGVCVAGSEDMSFPRLSASSGGQARLARAGHLGDGTRPMVAATRVRGKEGYDTGNGDPGHHHRRGDCGSSQLRLDAEGRPPLRGEVVTCRSQAGGGFLATGRGFFGSTGNLRLPGPSSRSSLLRAVGPAGDPPEGPPLPG
jgi:hypothetical protein